MNVLSVRRGRKRGVIVIMIISKRAQNISPSLTLAISAKAKKMQEDGIRVINFSVGEPDFNTPTYIIEAAKKAMDKGATKYTPVSGIVQLRQAICAKLKKDNNLVYNPNQIVVNNGAKQSLFNALQAIVNPGDEVIIPAPYWLTYPELVKLCDGVPIFVDTTNFKITAKQLESAITPKTKAFILNSPNNPTGAVYSKAEIVALAKVVEKHNIWVISDEIYEHLNYTGERHYSIAEYSEKLYNRTIVVNGMSKSFAMTGWRVGYTASSREVAEAMQSLQSHQTSNINTPTQWASVESLVNPEGEKFLKDMVGTFAKRREYIAKRINAMPSVSCVIPDGAFYVMMDVSKLGKSAHAIAEVLLEKAKIATVPGEAFGAPNHIRLSYALSMEDIEKGMDALCDILSQ